MDDPWVGHPQITVDCTYVAFTASAAWRNGCHSWCVSHAGGPAMGMSSELLHTLAGLAKAVFAVKVVGTKAVVGAIAGVQPAAGSATVPRATAIGVAQP